MFKKTLSAITAAAVIGTSTAFANPKPVETARIQLKSAKKISVKVSCGKPQRNSIVKKSNMWTFTVAHGDVGKCPTDGTAKNAAAYVPHMERAEVTGHNRPFPKNKKIRVAAMMQVAPGSSAVHNSSLFQVHQWLNGCDCGPPVLMSFDKSGRLRARILRERHKHNAFNMGGWTRKDFEGKWVEIAVDITNVAGKSDVEIFIGGNSVLKQKALIFQKGDLYFKAGIYREGSSKKTLSTERVYMKDPTYAILN